MHIKQKQCSNYIADVLVDSERQLLEDHIYSCDECLAIYMSAIEADNLLPCISDEETFTSTTMFRIQENNVVHTVPVQRKTGKGRWYESTVGYYAIAAGITFFLMSTGVFDQLLQLTSLTKTEKHVSISDSLMNKTITMIDLLEDRDKGGEVNE